MSAKHIVVIGAGIVGVATAVWLRRDGNKVTLLDRAGPAAGASHGNGGIIVPSAIVPVNAPPLIKTLPAMLTSPTSPVFVRWRHLPRMASWLSQYLRRSNRRYATRAARALQPLLADSVAAHQALADGTPAAARITPGDYVFIYDDRRQFEKDAFAWRVRDAAGIARVTMTAAEFADYDPIFGAAGKFAVRMPGHAFVADPGRYVEELAAHFVRDGGAYRCLDVTGVTVTGGGVTGVTTTAGGIDCDAAVIACGVWSKRLAETAGVAVPLQTERGYHVDFLAPSALPRTCMMVAAGKFVVTPMRDRIRCAGLVEFGGLDAPPSRAPIHLIKRTFTKTWRDIKYDSVSEWMGHRPAPVDSIPFIGAFDNTPNLYAAFGHHHVGLTAGAKTGQIIADLIAGRDPGLDLQPYRVSRFTR